MGRCPYNERLESCPLSECVLAKMLSEDGVDSLFYFIEILAKKEKRENYDQLIKTCIFFKETKETVEEILNNAVRDTYEDVYGSSVRKEVLQAMIPG